MKINPWITEVVPEFWGKWPKDSDKKGNAFIIRHEKWGLYSKRDAKIISQFLRLHGYSLIQECAVQN